MFSKIVVALTELPESQRALRTAIDLAASFNASLVTASLLGDLPAYAALATIVDPTGPVTMQEQRREAQEELHALAAGAALDKHLRASHAIIEGSEVSSVLHFLKDQNADLLVIGLHQHDFLISRLWSSVYDLAQEASCSVLGVH